MNEKNAGSFARALLLGFAVIGMLPVVAYANSASSGTGSFADKVLVASATAISVREALNPVICDGTKFWNPRMATAAGFDVRADCTLPVPSAVRPKTSNSGPGSCASGDPTCSRPVYCTLEYAPVVCSDGATYSNKCFARIAGQYDCDRIVSPCSTGAADCAPTPTPFACASGAVDCPSLVSVDDSTGSEIKAKWLAHISAIKAIHAKYDEKDDDAEDEVEIELKNRCRRPFISSEEYYKCLRSELKPNDGAYWHFGFAALIEKAQKLSEYGVPQAEIDAFVSFVKEQSIAFDAATTVEEKRKILNSVNDAWKEFRKKAYYWMVENRISGVAKKVEDILPRLKEIQAKLDANGIETERLDKVIAKLEENLGIMTSTDASVTLRQKWVAAHESVQLLKHVNRLINALVNGQAADDIVVSAAIVPSEVAVAASVAADVSTEAAVATPIASIDTAAQAAAAASVEAS